MKFYPSIGAGDTKRRNKHHRWFAETMVHSLYVYRVPYIPFPIGISDYGSLSDKDLGIPCTLNLQTAFIVNLLFMFNLI